ncbi:hypothetical protein [uncultured Microscilla sp.]|uniref:hypothetical protein n=1 Tax=uncultured Microscilla sp. TaxID=432653 RepID=UPI00263152C6|nr:hypothetical protein [uncultured Microscilla sp.]
MAPHSSFKPLSIPRNFDSLIFLMLFCYSINATLVDVVGFPNIFKPLFLLCSVTILTWSLYSHKPPIYQLKVIIGFCFLGIEQTLFILPLIILPQMMRSTKKLSFQIPHLILLLYLTYCLVLMLFYTIIDFSFFTPILWYLITGGQLILFLHYYRYQYDSQDLIEILSFFKKLILLQVIFLAAQLVIHRSFYPGDLWSGSFHDADKAGFFLLLLLIYYIIPPFLLKNQSLLKLKSRKGVVVLAMALAVLLCDAKILSAITIVSSVLYVILTVFSQLFNRHTQTSTNKTTLTTLLIFMSSFFVLSILNLYLNRISAGQINNIFEITSTYTGSTLKEASKKVLAGTNTKAVLYHRTYSQWARDNPFTWFFGAGPGRFDSRTSNILAYDILYKDENQFRLPSVIPPYSSYWVKKYMNDVWTKEISEAARWRSANLSFPFAGLIAIKAETGLVGLVLFHLFIFSCIYFLKKKLDASNTPIIQNWTIIISIFWLSLPLQMLIDNIQEKPQIMLPMLLLTTIILKTNMSAQPK